MGKEMDFRKRLNKFHNNYSADLQIWVCRTVCYSPSPLLQGGAGGEAPAKKRARGGGVGGAFSQAAPRANVAFMRHLRAATSFVLKGVSLGVAAAL